jgi:Uma2 family endonuclease
MATASRTPDTSLLTGEAFARLDIAERCELVAGRIVPMPPPPNHDHSQVVASVCWLVYSFVKANQLGRVGAGEGGLYTSFDPDTVRGADVTFTSTERIAQRDPEKTYLDVAPNLIVEVLSPSNRPADMAAKLREYFAIGVELVWLVDPESRQVQAHRSMTSTQVFHENDTLTADDVLPGFAVRVAQFFE